MTGVASLREKNFERFARVSGLPRFRLSSYHHIGQIRGKIGRKWTQMDSCWSTHLHWLTLYWWWWAKVYRIKSILLILAKKIHHMVITWSDCNIRSKYTKIGQKVSMSTMSMSPMPMSNVHQVHHVHVHHVHVHHEPTDLQKYSIHWVFEAFCICLCVHHAHVYHDHVLHVHVHIIFEILEPPAIQKYNIHWVFEALCICLCMCICLCVCHWHCQMTADIILCPAVYDMWGLTWSWDDIKGIYSKSWSDDRQTNKQIFKL